MGILKKIWYWFFEKKEVGKWEKYKARKLEEVDVLSKEVKSIKKEIEGIKIKGGVNMPPITARPEFTPPPQNPTRDFKREADEHFRQQQSSRNNDDNFLTGALVGYVFADNLNGDNSHKAVEETKSSNYESSYTPNSSSSYASGSYSSSSDSGSSSCSYDSGC